MRLARLAAVWVGIAIVATACAAPGTNGGGGVTSPGPSPSKQSLPQLQLDVLRAAGGRLAYCDPDVYPIERLQPIDAAKQRLPHIRANPAVLSAILGDLKIPSAARLTDRQIIAISDAYKQMNVIHLQRMRDGFSFSVSVPATPGASATGFQTVDGTVSPTGSVHITARHEGHQPNCPICLARGDLIGTPSGPVAVQSVRVGIRVWSADARGRRIEARVMEVGRSLAPVDHQVVRIELADGRTVVASPGHPAFDGEPIGAFRVGDPFDGSTIAAVSVMPYQGRFTYDLLASGRTGAYFVGGVLLRSTLAPSAAAALRSGPR